MAEVKTLPTTQRVPQKPDVKVVNASLWSDLFLWVAKRLTITEALMARGALLLLLGVPIPIIILLFLFWH